VAAVLLVAGLLGLVMTVGADARWLAALGGIVVRDGIPHGIPYASAPSGGWPNTLVLAELVFHYLIQAMGDRGLIVANLVAVLAALSVLSLDARRAGARGVSIAAALALVGLGSVPSLAVARIQMFSLVLFPVLVALLRAEGRRPSWRIWLSLPLLALWSNLHGAVLAGVAVLYAYLALERARRQPALAAAVAVLAPVAICLTPAGIRTIDYFRGLVSNVAAQQGLGQWAPLGSGPFDAVLVVTVLLLGVRLVRRRPALWEIAVIAGLTILTIRASRDGVWLLFFLVTPSCLGARRGQTWAALIPFAAAAGAALVVADLVRAPAGPGAGAAVVRTAIRDAGGGPVLADGIPAEQVALAGGRIWAGNPIDAFSHSVQNSYVNWLSGRPDGRAVLANARIRVVLVTRGSDADRLTRRDPKFRPVAADRGAVVYERAAG
jgi:hypothetical protein